MSEAAVRVEGLTVGYGRGAPVLNSVDLALAEGAVSVLVGPNGSGKSTLLMALARILPPRSGRILLGSDPLERFGARALARRIAVLPQQPQAPEGILLRDLVRLGRHPRRGLLTPWRIEDETAVTAALAATGLTALAQRPLDRLSGGQRQRGWIAMALAQDADILVLDEPTSFLDIAHQLDVLTLLRRLNAERGTTVVAALHDLGQAATFADHVAVLKDGRVHAAGPPDAVLTPERIADVFDVEGRLMQDDLSGAKAFLAMRRKLDNNGRVQH